tara:strand:+ start:624 stop:1232 length:609 start_codon:yes stop_codon:yes gene_type:complete
VSENAPSNEFLSAINAWKVALLDLTGRNQLLFLKDYKYQIDLDKFNDEDGNNFQTEKFINDLMKNSEDDQFEIAPMDYFIEDPTEEVIVENKDDVDKAENQNVESERLDNIIQILNEYGFDNNIFDSEIIQTGYKNALKIFIDSGHSKNIEKWEVENISKLIEEAKRIIKDMKDNNEEDPKKNISDLEEIRDLLNRLRDDDS